MSSTAVRRTKKRLRGDVGWVLGGIAAFALVAIGRWVNEHRAVSVLIALPLVIVGLAWVYRYAERRVRAYRGRHAVPTDIRAYQAMGDKEFEYKVAALCERDGCTDIEVVGGGGDLAADVLAKLPGRRWWQVWLPRRRRILIQCKRYQDGNRVGSEHVQMVNGTYRDIHGCDLAAIVTTSTFTRDAAALAARLRIRLYDGAALQAWADGTGRPPWA